MKRIFACLMALAMMLSVMACAEENATLVVSGSGTVSVAPDKAVITFGVRESSSDIAEAQAYVNSHLGQAVEKLKAMGISEDDIQTSIIRIEEDYNNVSSIPGETVYMVENTISVIVGDIESVGSTIDAVFASGANYFSGIQFVASDTQAAQAEALTMAVESASDRAALLAEATGMELGRILKVNNSGDYYSGDNRAYAKTEGAADSFAGQVYTSDIDVTVSVTMEYELLPND